MRHATNATTRTRTASIRVDREPLLRRGAEIASAGTALRYRIDRLIGQGGYGQVYTARRNGRSRTVPDTLAIKVSRGIDAWIREAYFGQILDGNPRAIAIYDAFVVTSEWGSPLYCLALEYARQGDLSAYLRRTSRRWKETIARREIAGILQVLGQLHRGQLLHRDLTPLNVFVCDGAKLKLGDFGIVRQQRDKRGITARTLNPLMAPSDIFAGAAPKWQARDDVYQVGQLLGMLIKGDASTPTLDMFASAAMAGSNNKVGSVVGGPRFHRSRPLSRSYGWMFPVRKRLPPGTADCKLPNESVAKGKPLTFRLSKNQHAIAVAVKTVAFGHGGRISAQDKFAPRKGRHEHQQGGTREMKVG